jgi:hypothetical protein
MQGGIIAPQRAADTQGMLDAARTEVVYAMERARQAESRAQESEATRIAVAKELEDAKREVATRESCLLQETMALRMTLDTERKEAKEREQSMQGGIMAPLARRNPIRVSEGRIRTEIDDFSPWKGLIYDCGTRGPQLSSVEELDADMKNGKILAVRFIRLNIGTAESDAIWGNCVKADYAGCGGISRFTRGIGLSFLSPGISASEFITATAKPKYDFGAHTKSPESIYRMYFSLGSKADLKAGAFQKECGTDFSPGLHIGWAVETGLSKKILSSLEGGCVSHVFWMWWIG